MTRKRASEIEPRSVSKPAGRPAPANQLANRDKENLRTRNENLERENAELHCLIDYRSQFLARLAHELRNPLTSILGFTEILLNHEQLTTAQEDFCQKVRNSAHQIQAHLSQIADLARLEAGRGSLSLEEFSLAAVLREASQGQQREAGRHNVQLRCSEDAEAGEIVSDRSKVRQVLYNLLAHAISRGPDASVVSGILEQSDRGFCLRIEDEGEQLPDSSRELLSAPLRSDQKIAPDQLGLAMSRQLIDVLGARLSIQKREPRGVTITIQFPARPPGIEDQS